MCRVLVPLMLCGLTAWPDAARGEDPKPESPKPRLTGWIQSPLLQKTRKFQDAQAPCVLRFLESVDRYEPQADRSVADGASVFDSKGKTPQADKAPAVDFVYDRAIAVKIFPRPRPIKNDLHLDSLREFLKEHPHYFTIRANQGVLHEYNHVSIKKLKDHVLFKKLGVGDETTVKVGNMPCLLVLDCLTVPFVDSPQAKSEGAVHPRVMLPYITEQKTVIMLAKAAQWRLFEWGYGWPAGSVGEDATLKVAKELELLCEENDAWAYHLRQLAEVSKSKEVARMLMEIELRIGRRQMGRGG